MTNNFIDRCANRFREFVIIQRRRISTTFNGGIVNDFIYILLLDYRVYVFFFVLPISSVVIPGRIAAAPISKTSREIYTYNLIYLCSMFFILNESYCTLQTLRIPSISSAFSTLIFELARTFCSEIGILVSA